MKETTLFAEYYYDRRLKSWVAIDAQHIKDGKPEYVLEYHSEMVEKLRNARKNNEFLIFSNKDLYPGLHADYVYIYKKALRMIYTKKLPDGSTRRMGYIVYNRGDVICYRCLNLSRIINIDKILETFEPDYTYAVDFVEKTAKAAIRRGSFIDAPDPKAAYEARLKEVCQELYNQLDDGGKLYYQLEGKFNLS